MVQDLILDPAIRDWVLFPLTLIMLLSGLIRHYVTLLLQSPPKPQSLSTIRSQRAITRGQILRQNASYLPPSNYLEIKNYLIESYESGYFLESQGTKEEEEAKEPVNPMDAAGLDGMMGMVKMQAVQFLPQTILMYYIGYFFNGFVLTKLPFPLTNKFKEMLQRGIETPNMDVRWVSSISWYFLCLFGLNSVYRLILGETNAADGTKDMSQMAGGMMGMAGGGGAPAMALPGQAAVDYKKLFAAERENLDIVEYSWVCEGVEERLLKKFGSKRI